MISMALNYVKKKFRYSVLKGDAYDVGRTQGESIIKNTQVVRFFAAKRRLINSQNMIEINSLYEEFSPSLLEEINGFADALGVPTENLRYHNYTWLTPRCSQFVVLPSKNEEGKIYAARNYDFSYRLDDMRFCKTSIKNNYSNMGFSTLFFGRIDGINEKGLAITMSSAGLPVGKFPSMKNPKIVGLQFWAVMRIILDKCKDVDEAIKLVEKIPMAYNANFIVSDKSGSAALIETYDGEVAHKKISSSTTDNFLCATNHVVLPELVHNDSKKMQNSKVRFELIQSKINGKDIISKNDIKKILSDTYPNGLCCHYYTQFFGTMNSAIYNPIDRKVDICFGASDCNPWYSLSFEDSKIDEYEVLFPKEKAPIGFWDLE